MVDIRNRIYSYDVSENKWNYTSIVMPTSMLNSGIVSSIDEKYIAIIGGEERIESWSIDMIPKDDIWIFNVDDSTFKKSKIKCPKKAPFKAVSIVLGEDKHHSSLLTVGYIRKLQNKLKILIIPTEIINLIDSMVIKQTVHIMESKYSKTDTGHWKIDGKLLFES